MKKQLATILIAIAGTTAIADHADAYATHSRWGGNNATLRASSVSFPAGAWRDALTTVTSRYYSNPSEFWFTQAYGDTSVGFNNGQSEVWFSSSSSYNPAVTFWWNNWWNGRMREADVVFWTGGNYTTSMTKTALWTYGGSRRPFQTTAAHEYGHAAGLLHEDDEYNIMGQDWTHLSLNSQTARSYVGEDACDGLVALYGRASGGSFEDVGVVHQRWTGRSGEYSIHGFTRMFNSGGGLLSSSSYNGQRRYNLNRGSVVRAEFSWENNGETTQYPHIAFYISTNSYISTGDRRIGTGSLTLGRNSVYTVSTSLYIPSDLTRGQTYYLGAIVDYDNRIGETDSANNAAYHIIRIN